MISSTQVVKQNTPALEQRIAESIQAGLVAAAKVYGEQFDTRCAVQIEERVKTLVTRIEALENKPEPVVVVVKKKFTMNERLRILFIGE